jgi:hypothetical protein
MNLTLPLLSFTSQLSVGEVTDGCGSRRWMGGVLWILRSLPAPAQRTEADGLRSLDYEFILDPLHVRPKPRGKTARPMKPALKVLVNDLEVAVESRGIEESPPNMNWLR